MDVFNTETRRKLFSFGQDWARDNLERLEEEGVDSQVCFDLAVAALGYFGRLKGERQLTAEHAAEIVSEGIQGEMK